MLSTTLALIDQIDKFYQEYVKSFFPKGINYCTNTKGDYVESFVEDSECSSEGAPQEMIVIENFRGKITVGTAPFEDDKKTFNKYLQMFEKFPSNIKVNLDSTAYPEPLNMSPKRAVKAMRDVLAGKDYPVNPKAKPGHSVLR